MPRTTLARLCAVTLAVFVALTACGPGSQSPVAATAPTGDAGASTSVDTSSEQASPAGSYDASDAPPPAETGGTEQAGPTGGAEPSLSVASLPIGANAYQGCLTVRFIGSASEIPAGLGLLVTGVTFDPPTLAISGPGCPGERVSCLGGLTLTESSSNECFLPVGSAGPPFRRTTHGVAAPGHRPQDPSPDWLGLPEKLRPERP